MKFIQHICSTLRKHCVFWWVTVYSTKSTLMLRTLLQEFETITVMAKKNIWFTVGNQNLLWKFHCFIDSFNLHLSGMLEVWPDMLQYMLHSCVSKWALSSYWTLIDYLTLSLACVLSTKSRENVVWFKNKSKLKRPYQNA